MNKNLEDIQKKSELINAEITSKNYDKTAFLNFCLSKKENGDDLNSWSLDELKNLINEFKCSMEKKKTADLNCNSKINQNNKKTENFNIEKEVSEKMEIFNGQNSEIFKVITDKNKIT